jgi:hypothetical protein
MDYSNLLFKESKKHEEETFKRPPSFGKGVWGGKENQAPSEQYLMEMFFQQQALLKSMSEKQDRTLRYLTNVDARVDQIDREVSRLPKL